MKRKGLVTFGNLWGSFEIGLWVKLTYTGQALKTLHTSIKHIRDFPLAKCHNKC